MEVNMKLTAINEEVASFTPSRELGEISDRDILNKLMRVRSWKGLISFLQTPGVGRALAKKESEPLTGCGIPSNAKCWCKALLGKLNTQIDRITEIDYLDDVTKHDLLSSGETYEVWLPELLSYAEDYRCLLTLAAVALGRSPAPIGMFKTINPLAYCEDEGAKEWFGKCVGASFRNGAEIGFLSLDATYWPASEFGPYTLYEDECCFACELGDKGSDYRLKEDERQGVLGFRFYAGGDVDLYITAFDKGGMSESVAERIACGLIVSSAIGRTIWEEDSSFRHVYADFPKEVDGGTFSLDEGFGLVSEKNEFSCWQECLTGVVERAILSGNVTLCKCCGAPIITKSGKDRVEYCCNSHKTTASKQRRERTVALCLQGVPVGDAIAEIGESYSESVARWYKEARALGRIN
jgi:hypothetical protein